MTSPSAPDDSRRATPSVAGKPAIVTPVAGESTAIAFTKIVHRSADGHAA